MKPTCRWMPGTRNSLCDRMDCAMVGDDGIITCSDCLDIEHEQAFLHTARLGSTYDYPVVERNEAAYQAWLSGHSGMRKRWLLALDWWAPNYNQAWIRAYVRPVIYGGWMIAVHGGDDDSCNQFFPSEADAMKVWDRIPPVVDHRTLVDLGFNF